MEGGPGGAKGSGRLKEAIAPVWGGGVQGESPRTRRMNGNIQPQGVGGRGNLYNAPQTWEVRDSQDSKEGGNLR